MDFKDTGCKTPDIAFGVIADLSALLGTPPSAVTETGHGYQPYWPVLYCDSPGT